MERGDGRGTSGKGVRGLPGIHSYQEFHSYFAPAFGRKQWRERSGQYLQGLLVQSEERRNAENRSETVAASPRVMPRFLTEARWDDDLVTGRLQEYLGTRLGHPLLFRNAPPRLIRPLTSSALCARALSQSVIISSQSRGCPVACSV